jgi:hypothetical protein
MVAVRDEKGELLGRGRRSPLRHWVRGLAWTVAAVGAGVGVIVFLVVVVAPSAGAAGGCGGA